MSKPTEKDVEKAVGKLAFNRLKKKFGLKYAFVDATLADGTVVKVEPAIEEGAEVFVIDAEGNNLAAPDGEHQLEDGSVIVTEGGVIIQIVEAPVADESEQEEMSADGISPVLTEILADVANRLNAIESKFKAQTILEAKFNALEKKVNELKGFAKEADVTALKSEVEAAKELVVKMANESKESPIKQPKKKGSDNPTKEEMEDAAVQNFSNVLFKRK